MALIERSDELVFTLFTHEAAAVVMATKISWPVAFANGWSESARSLHPLVGLKGTTY